MRTRDEGGTVFTVCDKHWKENHGYIKAPEGAAAELMVEAFSMHEHRWWATYNAALTGIYAGDYPVDGKFDAHGRSDDAATLAHGELEK